MKKISIILLVFTYLNSFSQNKYDKEFSLITDNDLYVSTYKDKYYTNGLFLSYRYLTSTKKENQLKKIIEYQLGHLMYTPYKSTVSDITEHDRPFAAYLYGSFGINTVYKNNTLLNTSLQLGTIGSAAFGKELQDFIHSIYGFDEAVGWEYQIKNALGINFSATYIKYLAVDTTNYFDFHWISNAKVGTIFTDISSGFYTRIGFKPLQKLANSIAFNTHLNNENTNFFNHIESFLYIKTMLSYNLYDATIEGSFLNTGSPVTKELIPFNFYLDVGIRFTVHKYNFGYSVKYNTDKSKGLFFKNDNIYGTILINYTF